MNKIIILILIFGEISTSSIMNMCFFLDFILILVEVLAILLCVCGFVFHCALLVLKYLYLFIILFISVVVLVMVNAISRPIRTYFTRWLIRTTSLVRFCTICLDPSDG